jgi:hypothetical protein
MTTALIPLPKFSGDLESATCVEDVLRFKNEAAALKEYAKQATDPSLEAYACRVADARRTQAWSTHVPPAALFLPGWTISPNPRLAPLNQSAGRSLPAAVSRFVFCRRQAHP